MLKAQTFVLGWARAQNDRRGRLQESCKAKPFWCRPSVGRLKLNVDAAVREDKCGLGWCLRDAAGSFVTGAAKPRTGRLSSLEAELIGIMEALSWLQGTDWKIVDVESDASRAIMEITRGSSCSSYGLVADDIRDIAKNFSSISFSHIRRSANRIAHELARAACSMSDLHSWFYYILPVVFIFCPEQ
ncbi:unnamed protein product [Cuscuta epithymum]|uniref:RNase H type-1 domain-containing protein n=1 Tax=Cuscuta epithymum TaxID=186058 RepID=A0AAV0EP94_9ASTE|nr:unnamed protein product [Cuscuta epithymum]